MSDSRAFQVYFKTLVVRILIAVSLSYTRDPRIETWDFEEFKVKSEFFV